METKVPHFDQDLLWCENCNSYQEFAEKRQGPFVAFCKKCNNMARASYFRLIEKEHPAVNRA